MFPWRFPDESFFFLTSLPTCAVLIGCLLFFFLFILFCLGLTVYQTAIPCTIPLRYSSTVILSIILQRVRFNDLLSYLSGYP